MDNKPAGSSDKNWLVWGGLYTLIFLALGGYLNYTEPYSPGPLSNLTLWSLILYVLAYLPIIILRSLLAGK